MAIEKINYVTVGIKANDIVEYAAVAYWSAEHRKYMHASAVEKCRELAALLGFDLVERPPVEQPEQIAAE